MKFLVVVIKFSFTTLPFFRSVSFKSSNAFLGLIWDCNSLFKVLIFIYFFNNRKQTITSNDQPTITAPVTTPNNNDNPVRNNSPGANNTIAPATTTTVPANSSTGLPVDSNAIAPVTGPVLLQPDTAAVKTNTAPVFTPPVVTAPKNNVPDSTKKGRGVKGITDSDYKIVPKKDSSKS